MRQQGRALQDKYPIVVVNRKSYPSRVVKTYRDLDAHWYVNIAYGVVIRKLDQGRNEYRGLRKI